MSLKNFRLNWRRNWEKGLIWFNLDRIKRNWKFKDGFEINSQVIKPIVGLIEEESWNWAPNQL